MIRTVRTTLVSILLAGLLVHVGCDRAMRLHLVDKPAPAFSLKSLDSTTTKLADFRGRPVVLAFWAYG